MENPRIQKLSRFLPEELPCLSPENRLNEWE